MAYNHRSIPRKIFRTAHRILLDRLLFRFLYQFTGDILVLGAGQEPYRDFLPTAKSLTLTDIGPPSDTIDFTVDAHSIQFEDSSYDHVLGIEVFEHLQRPDQASAEIFRVLKPNGTAFLSIPFMFRIHADPHDYQRLTSAGIACLFSQFKSVDIIPYGTRLHVISDIITTSCKVFLPLRILNWILTLYPASRASLDCPSGYIVLLEK